MKKNKVKVCIAIVVSLLYIIVGVATLKNYGISWDEPTHFRRGQAYLQYLLTHKKTYEGLALYNLEQAKIDPTYHERSFYQSDIQNGNHYLTYDDGHPPLNGILASIFNLLFYQKIHLFGDVESYHFFEVVISAAAVGAVFLFACEAVGVWAGLFSAVFLATYPLFWAESHFNIKDPIETSFFTLTIFGLWLAFKNKSYKWVLITAIFAGFALGTKFNILFLPFIIVPWLIINYFNKRSELLEILKNKKFLVSLILFPVIMFLIFFVSWPYLWHDTLNRIFLTFSYYAEIGTEADLSQQIASGKWNLYPLKWIVAATSLGTLFFTFLGIIFAGKWVKKQENFVVLWFLWLMVPILRVSFPGASIYGGIRQLMEYIPALALFAGLGAESVRIILSEKIFLFKFKGRTLLSCILLIIITGITIIPLAKIHPNENVYFNSIFGGLSPLMISGFPAAGNSFGNAYKQGLDWLVKNASDGSKLALIQGTSLNIPQYKIPPKINFSNAYLSGIDRKGEYLMEVTYNAEVRVYFYDWEYVEKMLEPVYEVKVDGAPILKIWKNDLEHTRPEYRLKEIPYNKDISLKIDEDTLIVKLPEEVILSRLILTHQNDGNCQIIKSGFIESSIDGSNWVKEGDLISTPQIPSVKPTTADMITYCFAARKMKEVKLILGKNSCALLNPQMKLIVLN